MSIIIITAIVSLLIAGVFLAALIWSIKDGQYEDDFAPPNRILFDEKNATKDK
ncbi:MAG: cbb3-type cytochrome oxidase assembly protein CcoS [Niabella sp.]